MNIQEGKKFDSIFEAVDQPTGAKTPDASDGLDHYGMYQIENPKVLASINKVVHALLGDYSANPVKNAMSVGTKLKELRQKFNFMGFDIDLSSYQDNYSEEEQHFEIPINRFGGRFGKTEFTPHNEFLDDDGIKKSIGHSLSLYLTIHNSISGNRYVRGIVGPSGGSVGIPAQPPIPSQNESVRNPGFVKIYHNSDSDNREMGFVIEQTPGYTESESNGFRYTINEQSGTYERSSKSPNIQYTFEPAIQEAIKSPSTIDGYKVGNQIKLLNKQDKDFHATGIIVKVNKDKKNPFLSAQFGSKTRSLNIKDVYLVKEDAIIEDDIISEGSKFTINMMLDGKVISTVPGLDKNEVGDAIKFLRKAMTPKTRARAKIVVKDEHGKTVQTEDVSANNASSGAVAGLGTDVIVHKRKPKKTKDNKNVHPGRKIIDKIFDDLSDPIDGK